MGAPYILSRRVLAADIPGTDLHAGDIVLTSPSRFGVNQVTILCRPADDYRPDVTVDIADLRELVPA